VLLGEQRQANLVRSKPEQSTARQPYYDSGSRTTTPAAAGRAGPATATALAASNLVTAPAMISASLSGMRAWRRALPPNLEVRDGAERSRSL
jgi:hypothetical protein